MMHGREKSDLAIVCAGQRPDREATEVKQLYNAGR
jgi:hypothetical protein